MTRFTRHQVPRGSRPDAEYRDRDVLVKNVSCLRLTYQLRVLTLRAESRQKKLVVLLPRRARIHATLRDFKQEHRSVLRLERFD